MNIQTLQNKCQLALSKLTPMYDGFAVIVELEPTVITEQNSEYARHRKSGELLKVDIIDQDKNYSICFKCGSNLEAMANEVAIEKGGVVVKLKAD